ncbi:MAG: alpha/beta fold hydrolase [Alphaproteobacteria bacterium]
MKFIEIEGARIAYREAGCGVPLVLLHSSVSSSGQWKSLIAHLGEGFHTLVPDLYGYGASSAWPGERPLEMADEAKIVARLVAEIPGPFHLVGHSYGGAIALRVALTMPARVASLVLIEPVAFYLLKVPALAREQAEIEAVAGAVIQAVADNDPARGMASFVDYWNGNGAFAQMRPDLRQDLVSRTGKVLRDFEAIDGEQAKLADYSALAMPTLVLAAEKTRDTTKIIATLLAQTIPGAELMGIPGAGHMSPLTHGEIVNRAIAGHLKPLVA